MTPVDVTGPNTDEPVKVHHDGGGTHGAGGGGSGGGVVGQEGTKGPTEQSQKEDIVDGKPRDVDHPDFRKDSPKSSQVHSAPDAQTAHASSGGEAGHQKASGPNEAFAEWERQDMEDLLGELRGHLGESMYELASLTFSRVPDPFPRSRRCGQQLSIQREFILVGEADVQSDKILPLPIYN